VLATAGRSVHRRMCCGGGTAEEGRSGDGEVGQWHCAPGGTDLVAAPRAFQSQSRQRWATVIACGAGSRAAQWLPRPSCELSTASCALLHPWWRLLPVLGTTLHLLFGDFRVAVQGHGRNPDRRVWHYHGGACGRHQSSLEAPCLPLQQSLLNAWRKP
jgi:hypothetical protein